MSFDVVEAFSPLYKRDSKGKVRKWLLEIGADGSGRWAFRTVSGLDDGQKVTSAWKETQGKNIGRANETTAEEQARSEIESLYTKQRDKAYFDDVDSIDSFEKFKPMLAHDYAKRGVTFEKGDVFAQPKLDGMRCVARADGLWSRGGKEIVATPHIYEALSSVFESNPTLVIDGELYNHNLKYQFDRLMSLCRKTKPTADDLKESREIVEFHVYDMYDSEKPDLTFSERARIIADIIHCLHLAIPNTMCIVSVPTLPIRDQDHLDETYAYWTELGYEGQIIRYDTAYENKRSRNLLKRKDFFDEEFEVLNVQEGKGNWAGYVKRFVVNVDGEPVGCGVRGDQATLKALLEDGVKPDWAKVQHFGRTKDNSLRFPVVVDWGKGKRND